MSDPTEKIRREMCALINMYPHTRQELEQWHGKTWDTEQMVAEFEPQGFAAPFVVVKRRSDGVIGSLMFQHSPRFYFGWTEDHITQ